ncbi:dopamine D2-like receptor [Aphis craccivora]|uniref:Dopamine D2-like receptor n=1 Tax=Aphis craccivora TaxID=307492 RepID=A0A6G0ZIC8_APHCR|nr:dopamine D2-like receptor [Aphis craccivora]
MDYQRSLSLLCTKITTMQIMLSKLNLMHKNCTGSRILILYEQFSVYGNRFEVNGKWGLPPFVCDFYIAMDVICSTSSIFNLVAISIDRLVMIVKPLKYLTSVE